MLKGMRRREQLATGCWTPTRHRSKKHTLNICGSSPRSVRRIRSRGVKYDRIPFGELYDAKILQVGVVLYPDVSRNAFHDAVDIAHLVVLSNRSIWLMVQYDLGRLRHTVSSKNRMRWLRFDFVLRYRQKISESFAENVITARSQSWYKNCFLFGLKFESDNQTFMKSSTPPAILDCLTISSMSVLS
jgi:hypothetical protein